MQALIQAKDNPKLNKSAAITKLCENSSVVMQFVRAFVSLCFCQSFIRTKGMSVPFDFSVENEHRLSNLFRRNIRPPWLSQTSMPQCPPCPPQPSCPSPPWLDCPLPWPCPNAVQCSMPATNTPLTLPCPDGRCRTRTNSLDEFSCFFQSCPPIRPCPSEDIGHENVGLGQCPAYVPCPAPSGCPEVPSSGPISRWTFLCQKDRALYQEECVRWDKAKEIYSRIREATQSNSEEQMNEILDAAGDFQKKYSWIAPLIAEAILNETTTHGKLEMAEMLKQSGLDNRKFFQGLLMATHEAPELSIIKQEQSLLASTPAHFFPRRVIDSVGEWDVTYAKVHQMPTDSVQACITVDENVGSSNREEDQLWYFRESIGVNNHHALWHIEHSWSKTKHAERRGELFYYMHRNILARYGVERISNGMSPLKPLIMSLGGNVETGYAPNLHIHIQSNMQYSKRPSNSRLEFRGRAWPDPDVNPQLLLEEIVNKTQAIRTFLSSGMHANLRAVSNPIDVFADGIESSTTSTMPQFKDLHNTGHDILSHLEKTGAVGGVIGDIEAAMRDPVFYQWHAYIDGLINSVKKAMSPYNIDIGDYPLLWRDVELLEIQVHQTNRPSDINNLHTFWRNVKYNFQQTGKDACVKELDHGDFILNLKIINRKRIPVTATVRVFLTPVNDKYGNALTLEKQQELMVPIDVFNAVLSPGENVISRNSEESTITTSRERYKEGRCDCGWPHNLLLPRGKCPGQKFELFVALTDGNKYPFLEPPKMAGSCKRASVICGLSSDLQRKYPDRVLPMGYPFDRLPYQTAPGVYPRSLSEYERNISNFKVAEITIIHHDVLVENDWDSWERFDSPDCKREPITPVPSSTITTTQTVCPECIELNGRYVTIVEGDIIFDCPENCWPTTTITTSTTPTTTTLSPALCPPECQTIGAVWFIRSGHVHYCSHHCPSPTPYVHTSGPRCTGWYYSGGRYQRCNPNGNGNNRYLTTATYSKLGHYHTTTASPYNSYVQTQGYRHNGNNGYLYVYYHTATTTASPYSTHFHTTNEYRPYGGQYNYGGNHGYLHNGNHNHGTHSGGYYTGYNHQSGYNGHSHGYSYTHG